MATWDQLTPAEKQRYIDAMYASDVMPPPRADAAIAPTVPTTGSSYRFGDVGRDAGNEALQAAYAQLAGAVNPQSSNLLDVATNYATGTAGGLLSGAIGLGQKAGGYAADVLGAGAEALPSWLGGDRWSRGGSAQALYGDMQAGGQSAGLGTEASALGLLSDLGAGKYARGAIVDRLNQTGPVPTMYSNPIAGLLGDAGKKDVGFDVWHGTPHEFPPAIRVLDKETGKTYVQSANDPVATGMISQQPNRYEIIAENPLGMFDFSKMGTGEGAQAYGWGGYLAEAKPVAVEYRNMLSGNPYGDKLEVVMGGKPIKEPTDIQWAMAEAPDKSKYVENLKSRLADAEAKVSASPKLTPGDDITDDDLQTLMHISKRNSLKEKLSEAESLLGTDIRTKPLGHLYEARLKANPEQFLDWDTPLGQQTPYVKAALSQLGVKPFDLPSFNREAALRVSKLAEADGLANWAKRDLMKAATEIDASPDINYTLHRLKQMQMDFGISPDSGPWKNTADEFLDFVRSSDVYKNSDMPAAIVQRLADEARATGAIGEDIADAYPAIMTSQKAASKKLLQAGIPGSRHLDANSRGLAPPKVVEDADGFSVMWGNDPNPVDTFTTRAAAEEAAKQLDQRTRNYVVFDENLINIVKKYGIAGAAAMLGMSTVDVEKAMAGQSQQPPSQGLLATNPR